MSRTLSSLAAVFGSVTVFPTLLLLYLMTDHLKAACGYGVFLFACLGFFWHDFYFTKKVKQAGIPCFIFSPLFSVL